MKSLGKNIKIARRKADISQMELANLIGKSYSSIQKYEQNLAVPPINVIEEIAKALNINKLEILDFSNLNTDMKVINTIKDSGERTEFDTGAVRDLHEGKGDMVSLPANAVLRLSKHYEAGAKKYGRWNYLKGIPVSSFIDSALRHIIKYCDGWDDEDHLAAAAFNVLGAMEMEKYHKELNDLPNREGKNTFDYGE